MKPNTKHSGNNMGGIPAYHLELVRDHSIRYRKINQVSDIAQVLHELLDRSPVEQFVVVYLDMKGEIIGAEKVAIGSLDKVHMSLKDMFRGAICACVSSIVLGHNHPHGICRPSNEDIVMTSMAIHLGGILGIEVVDHIIVSPNGDHYSIWDHQEECIHQVQVVTAQQRLRELESHNPLAGLLDILTHGIKMDMDTLIGRDKLAKMVDSGMTRESIELELMKKLARG